MKIKTLGRIGGAVNFLAGSFFGSYSSYLLSKADYDLLSLFSSDFQLSYKIAEAGLMAAVGMGIPVGALFIADGVTDIAKGTHHYFGCRLWQKLTQNEETRRKIDSELETQLKLIELNPER